MAVRHILFAVVGFIIFYLAALLFGCSGPMIFTKPGATTTDLNADSYACRQQWEQSAEATAFRADPLGNAFYGYSARGRLQECLEQKGWTRTNG